MADNLKKLARMANQIADFHKPYPHAEAIAGVHRHLKRFWSPQMIRDLESALKAGNVDVRPAVAEAFEVFGNAHRETMAKALDPKELEKIKDDAG